MHWLELEVYSNEFSTMKEKDRQILEELKASVGQAGLSTMEVHARIQALMEINLKVCEYIISLDSGFHRGHDSYNR
jgi:hypothetical protein